MKKIGLLVLAMIMVLGTLGVGYAYWTQNLYINGNVQTGELKVVLQELAFPSPNPDAYGATYVEQGTYISADQETLNVQVTGLYPGYNHLNPGPLMLSPLYEGQYHALNFQILNAGTIPVYVVPGYDTQLFFDDGFIEVWEDLDTGSISLPPGMRSSVIGPGQTLNGKVIVGVGKFATPEELTTWNFAATFTAHQANEP